MQTMARVIEFLADLGKDDGELKKRRGNKSIIIDPETADRYHSRYDWGKGDTPARA